MRLMTTLALGLAVGAILVRCNERRSDKRAGPRIRVAGPSEMRDPPGRWSDVDERSDESFPASDPPGTY